MPDRAIYHITHVDNLPGIIKEGRLWCDAQRIRKNLSTTNIGHLNIKARRMNRPVQVAVGGTLGEYVPFNFCPRSVMLSANYYNTVPGYDGGQRPIVHLVSSIDAGVQAGRPWFFTDGHADVVSGQFDDLSRLDEVDWSVMPLRWWNDPDVKTKRQAEFLVHDFFPWTAIEVIGVVDKDIASVVRETIAGADHQPQVKIKRNWYY